MSRKFILIEFLMVMTILAILVSMLEAGRLFKVGDRYIINGQQTFPWYDSPVCRNRVTSFFTSTDLRHWTKEAHFYRNEQLPCHVGIAVIDRIGATLVGLTGRFQEAAELPDQYMELGVVVSLDGLHWHEIAPECVFLRRGQTGDWDGGGILQGSGLVELEEQSLLYFGAVDCGNSDGGCRQIGVAQFPRRHYGRMGLRVGWNLYGLKSGYAVTRNIAAGARSRLWLHVENFDCPDAWVAVEVLDASGQPLTGVSDRIHFGGEQVPVVWNGNPELELPGEVALKIHFHGGCLREHSPYWYTLKLNSAGEG